MIRVAIVDDHELVRMGIKRLLNDEDGIDVIAEAASGEAAIQAVKQHQPDVVLLDVNMPGIGGLETTSRLVKQFPDIKIIALTAFHHDPYPTRVIQAGAFGYLTKESGLVDVVKAIRKVNLGQRFLSPEVAEQLAFKNVTETDTDKILAQISDREMQVLVMISNGMTVNEISKKLHLSSKTIHTYRYRMLEKLQLKNDVELTHFALRHNLITPVVNESTSAKVESELSSID